MKKILVISGAGISAESGIPTFRGAGGYWRKMDPASLATPEAFARDPELVWEWYNERRRGIRAAHPNAAHEAVVQLATNTPEFLLLTQNVDNLHARAQHQGQHLPRSKMVQIHGDIFLSKCSACDFSRREDEPEKNRATLPECPECGEFLRPGVVWFGEQLDFQEITRVEQFLETGACDLTLVIGTTAMFGYIVDWATRSVGRTGKLIEINPEETALSALASQSIREPAAIALPRLVVDRLGPTR